MRLSRVILAILVCTFIAQGASYYFILPDPIAAHFDASGRPDNWWSKSGFFIFDAVILLFLMAEFTLVPRWIAKTPPSLMNLPNKKYWLAPERRDETFAVMRHFFEWFAVLLLTLFTVVNQLVFRANISHENLNGVAIWTAVILFILAVVVWLAKFINHFRTVR
jgi:uncharacterized membrane protein